MLAKNARAVAACVAPLAFSVNTKKAMNSIEQRNASRALAWPIQQTQTISHFLGTSNGATDAYKQFWR